VNDVAKKSLYQKLSEMSDEELIKRFESLYQAVHIVECFGSREVRELMAVEGELRKRGYTIQEQMPKIVKET